MTGKWRNSIGLQVLQIGVASIVAPLILWIFSPDDSISLKWALPILALLLIGVAPLWMLLPNSEFCPYRACIQATNSRFSNHRSLLTNSATASLWWRV